ncbi:hypothetical protein JOC58_004508 [Paenibacillus hunanensis]|uniref:Uncharacterized protein n=1 Tax=Paenibacillus hunanensis TaxID=539262 RepID=A0ABU1J7W6_9BACL|nr:hypothetical protein [Paenibacillus hunanensis]
MDTASIACTQQRTGTTLMMCVLPVLCCVQSILIYAFDMGGKCGAVFVPVGVIQLACCLHLSEMAVYPYINYAYADDSCSASIQNTP